MNLLAHFKLTRTKENLAQAVQYIAYNQSLFKELMVLFFSTDHKINARAAHAMSHCVDRYPFLISPYTSKMIEHLQSNPNKAIKRNTVRILQNQVINERDQGLITEICFKYLLDSKESIAVKACSMTILYNMCVQYPDLSGEVILVIQDQMTSASPGVRNRGLKILSKLKIVAQS